MSHFQVIAVFSQCFKFPDRPSYFEYKEVLKRFLTTRYPCADYSGAKKKMCTSSGASLTWFYIVMHERHEAGFFTLGLFTPPTHSTNSPPHLSFLLLFLNEEKGSSANLAPLRICITKGNCCCRVVPRRLRSNNRGRPRHVATHSRYYEYEYYVCSLGSAIPT